MKNRVLALSLLSILVLSMFVSAIGSSTKSDVRRVGTSEVSTDTTAQVINCDDQTNTRARVKCRLEKNTDTEKQYLTEESCRELGATDKASCIELYQKSAACYEMTGNRKVACIREKANFNTERKTNTEEKRNYMVLLLYELQERVERKYEAGQITSDQAAALIDQIVMIKKSILAGEPRDTIKSELQELRTLWASSIPNSQ